MKHISKFLIILAAGAFASCNVFKEEMEPTKPIEAPAVTISVSNIADYSFSFTVAPEGDASFYSYVVLASPKAQALDSANLFALKVDDAIVKGTVKYADEASKTIEVKDLNAQTVYQIYAVAGSVCGNVGSVTVKQVKTTDSTAPELMVDEYGSVTSFAAKVENSTAIVGFEFDEPITLTDTATVCGSVYAIDIFTSYKDGDYLDEIGTFDIPADSIMIDENIMIIRIPEDNYVPGAYVSVSIMKGAVVNESGIANSEDYDVNYLLTDENENIGAWFRYEPVEFKLTPSVAKDSTVIYSDFSTVKVSFTADVPVPENNMAYTNPKADIQVSSVAPNGRTVNYSLANATFDDEQYVLTLGFDEAHGYGTKQSYSIPEAYIVDIFGNYSEAVDFKNKFICSFGYTLEDIIGDYAVTATSYFDGPLSSTLSIVESDNAEKGNIMLSKYMDFTCNEGNIYATFDLDAGNINIADMQRFAVLSGGGAKFMGAFAIDTEEENASVNLSVPAPGVIDGFDQYFGIVLFSYPEMNYLGWNDLYIEFYAERQ